MLPKNVCPDRAAGHNWVVMGVKSHDGYGSESEYKPGTLWRYCNYCHVEDRETHLCEMSKRMPGRWPHWYTCGAVAPVKSQYFPDLDLIRNLDGTERADSRRAPDGKDHWYCRAHDPERMFVKAVEKDRADTARYNDQTWKSAHGWYGKKVKELLEQLDQWGTANADLVESDEWLGTIMRDARSHLGTMNQKR